MKYLLPLLLLLCLTTKISSVSANEKKHTEAASTNNYDYSGWMLGIGYYGLDKQNARQQLIGDSATFVKMGWEGQIGMLVYGVGMNGFLLKDKGSFSERVEDNFGNRSTESSDADAFGAYGELGVSFAFASSNKFDLVGGFDILSADRSIGNCSDCRSEDIQLDGGLYLEPRLRMMSDSGFIFSIGYRKYMTGDINGGLNLSFTWSS